MAYDWNKPLIEQINWTHKQKVTFSLTCMAVSVACAYISYNYYYIAGIYVKPLVFVCVLAFMAGMVFCFHSVDEHKKNNPDDEDGGEWK